MAVMKIGAALPAAFLVGIAGFAVLATPGHASSPPEYTVAPEQSSSVVRVYKAGFAARLAHDHVIQSTRFSGTVSGDPHFPAGIAATLEIATDSLRADDPDLRRKFHLPDSLSVADRQSVESTMLGPQQLDAAHYPTIRFRLTRAVPGSAGAWQVTGELMLHGTTRTLSFPVLAQMDSATLRARGTVSFLQTEFGIRPYRAFLGAVRNKDQVEIIFDLVAIARNS